MPRRTRLSLISERPLTDDEEAMRAEQALDAAELPLASPDEVLAALRAQNQELARVASLAVEERNTALGRAETAETELSRVSRETDQLHRTAQAEVKKARDAAASQVVAAQQQSRAAEQATVAAGLFRQGMSMFGNVVAFLTDRAPVLLTLLGAYLLAARMLPSPDPYQLAELAIYGGVAVAPAVWFSRRS